MTTATTTKIPDPAGTPYAPKPGRPFDRRFADSEYESLEDTAGDRRRVVRRRNAEALRHIALELLSEPVLDDPAVRYAGEVLRATIEQIRAEGLSYPDDVDILHNAFDEAVRYAGYAVAAAWLRERGSILIPTD